MRRIIFLAISLVALLSCLTSCETDTIDGEGKIEGLWHLESVETMASDSTVDSVQNTSNKLIFWAFQRKILELDDKSGESSSLFCRFTVGGGQLTINEVYVPSYGADSLTTDVSLLKPYGINKLNPTFNYVIDGGKMTLTGEGVRLRFRKF